MIAVKYANTSFHTDEAVFLTCLAILPLGNAVNSQLTAKSSEIKS